MLQRISQKVCETVGKGSASKTYLFLQHWRRCFRQPSCKFASESRGRLVLGIETSCDDTGVAIVNEDGKILGEALHSQTKTHVEMGGIIPPIARDLHQQHIASVCQQCLDEANLAVEDVEAIAVTVKPGLALSLKVGLEHAKSLARQSRKPLIPIHHMEAHALTARMIAPVEFPFLVLLVSGGHCLLAVVRDTDDFLLLGRGLDDSPGDAFDKTARQLKLKNLPGLGEVSGGVAVEGMARQGDPRAFPFPLHVLQQQPSCHFSFAGIKFAAKKLILQEEARLGIQGGTVLPNAADICASFQLAVLQHLSRRLQRALLYCHLKSLLPEQGATLVVSGGVASNQFLLQGLRQLCAQHSCGLVAPPPSLCTDNGTMIAWNGMERLKKGIGLVTDLDSVDIQPKCPLGQDISEDVMQTKMKLPRLRLAV